MRSTDLEHMQVFFFLQMMYATLVSVLWLLCGACGDDGRDLIRGFSSDGPQAWTMSHRAGLWKHESAPTEMLRVINEDMLEFLPFPGDKHTAVFASRYLYPKEPILGNLRFQIGHIGEEASKVKINIDIHYLNSTIFHVDEPLRESGKTCFIIRDFGAIRALMLHIILEQRTMESVKLKDILLTTQGRMSHELACPLYQQSYPYFRQTIYNFLVPTKRTDETNHPGITVTTQLTFDRYPLLEEMVAQWRGPLSVAFFALDIDSKIDEVEELTKRYHENPLLHTYATIHLVYPDERNGADDMQFPINYLRNVALNGARTADVFLLDSGTLPAFTSQQATSWINSARAEEGCDDCVFIAPLFDAISYKNHIPHSKLELMEALGVGRVKHTALTSHGAVPASAWTKKDRVFPIKYKENMEPYFIAGLSAPLINEMYVGYGRDKCAYSSDVFRTGHRFFVLPNAFLVRKIIPHAKSILVRSRGIHLRMFTNIAFHLNDIEHGYFRYRGEVTTSKPDKETCTTGVCLDEMGYSGTSKYTINPQTPANNKLDEHSTKPNANASRNDLCEKWSQVHFVESGIFDTRPVMREDVILENLIRLYNVGIIIIISQTQQSMIMNYIHFTHPDAVVFITQSREAFKEEMYSDYMLSLSGQGNISSKLARVRQQHPGPAIIWNMLSENVTQLLLYKASENDILVVPNSDATTTLLRNLCVKHASWRIQTYEDKLFIKSVNTKKHPLVLLPSSPDLVWESTEAHSVTVDIILFTKNRPLQTLAFMKSLAYQVTGINKIYVQYVADDKEFEKGYSMIVGCMGNLDIVLVPEKKTGFRNTFLGLLGSLKASHVMLAVDELIWIRPVDLRVAADLLHRNQDTTVTFQLRLGQDVSVYTQIKNTNHVFKDVYPEQDILAYYPLRLPYDFGYVMQVDGILMSKAGMFTDFSEKMTDYFNPSSLENGWMRCCLKPRTRKWHLMYKTTRVFNNILVEDIRVAKMTSPGKNNYDLARRLLVDKTEIDVEKLTKSVVGGPVSTHMRKSVSYIALTCN